MPNNDRNYKGLIFGNMVKCEIVKSIILWKIVNSICYAYFAERYFQVGYRDSYVGRWVRRLTLTVFIEFPADFRYSNISVMLQCWTLQCWMFQWWMFQCCFGTPQVIKLFKVRWWITFRIATGAYGHDEKKTGSGFAVFSELPAI